MFANCRKLLGRAVTFSIAGISLNRQSWESPRDETNQTIVQTFHVLDINSVRNGSKLMTLPWKEKSIFAQAVWSVIQNPADSDPLKFYRQGINENNLLQTALKCQRKFGLQQDELLSKDNISRDEFYKICGYMLYLRAIQEVFESIDPNNGMYANHQVLDSLTEEEIALIQKMIFTSIENVKMQQKPEMDDRPYNYTKDPMLCLYQVFESEPFIHLIMTGKYSTEEIVDAIFEFNQS